MRFLIVLILCFGAFILFQGRKHHVAKITPPAPIEVSTIPKTDKLNSSIQVHPFTPETCAEHAKAGARWEESSAVWCNLITPKLYKKIPLPKPKPKKIMEIHNEPTPACNCRGG